MKALSAKERFAQYLENFGTAITSEEACVVEIIWAMHGTFRDDEVLSKAGDEVHDVIVLRTIARLIKAGLLQPVGAGGSSVLVTAWPR
jgi:hypothetical protein